MKVKKILAMALLTAGVLAASCSSEDNIADEPQTQQPEENVITLTATLEAKGDDGSGTRVITTGKDTDGKEILNVAWKKDEKIALYYQTSYSGSGYAKATATVTAVDETTHAATITAELDAYPTDGGEVKLIYPASLANTTGDDIDETLLLNQKGNLTGDNGISKKFDAATGTGKIVLSGGMSIPTNATVTNTDGTGSVSLQNRVCICKFHFDLDDRTGMASSIVEKFSPITINDGNGHTYTITSDRPDEQVGGMTRGFTKDDDIYVAMLPVENKTVTFSYQRLTSGGTVTYSYSVWPTTLAAGKFYRNLGTIQLVKGGYTNYTTSTVMVQDGETLRLNGATISTTSGPGIQCEGDATIILTGSNRVTASAEGQPAIFIAPGKTLTIQGEGSLTAESTTDGAAGIGGGWQGEHSTAGIDCGNIVIESGTITATGKGAGIGSGAYGTCGTITINGGTVTATGMDAGIGSGYQGSCGNITINGGTVTATTGDTGAAGIGSGAYGTCGTITIGGGIVTATGATYAAGIGSGYNGKCGAITIGGGLTSLTATMGDGAGAPIGSGKHGSCGSITIDGSTTWSAGKETTHYTWEASTVKDAFNLYITRWTLTKK